jgi:hypothetical protein
LATITALLAHQDATTEEQRAASLISGFEFGARLADTLHDEFLDTADGETKVERLMDMIVKAFDVIGSGRAALAVLLDHTDRSACFGWSLPDRFDARARRPGPPSNREEGTRPQRRFQGALGAPRLAAPREIAV